MSKETVSLILVRHGQSQWNLENRFTGWVDVELSAQGHEEAAKAALELKKLNIDIDACYTSVLNRAIHTLWILLKEMGISWLPVTKAWQLNERHYGGLQGLNKQETADQYGADQVKIWRRSYDTPPPEMDEKRLADQNIENHKYKKLGLDQLPNGESLKICRERVVPYYTSEIAPQLKAGKNLLVTAHGNSLRSLIMELEGLSGEKIMEVEIETAVPLVYTLDAQTLKILDKKILK